MSELTPLQKRRMKIAKAIYAESDKLSDKLSDRGKCTNLRIKLIKQVPEEDRAAVKQYVFAIGRVRQRAGIKNVNRLDAAIAVDKGRLKGHKL